MLSLEQIQRMQTCSTQCKYSSCNSPAKCEQTAAKHSHKPAHLWHDFPSDMLKKWAVHAFGTAARAASRILRSSKMLTCEPGTGRCPSTAQPGCSQRTRCQSSGRKASPGSPRGLCSCATEHTNSSGHWWSKMTPDQWPWLHTCMSKCLTAFHLYLARNRNRNTLWACAQCTCKKCDLTASMHIQDPSLDNHHCTHTKMVIACVQ